jgi:hypothetical protein
VAFIECFRKKNKKFLEDLRLKLMANFVTEEGEEKEEEKEEDGEGKVSRPVVGSNFGRRERVPEGARKNRSQE